MRDEISILMPVYNVEKYIREAIDSVLQQTSSAWKLIIVDDGSTDLSGEICDEYAGRDHRISVIHKENGGVASARKAGVGATETEYSIFLDSDDMLAPDCVEKVLAAIDAFQADMVIYTFLSYQGGKLTAGVAPLVEEPGLIRKECVQKLLLSTNDYNSLWTKAIRTDYLRNDPLMWENIPYNMGEDKLFLLYPVTVANRIAAIPDSLYYYRMTQGSLTHVYSFDKLVERMQIGVYEHLYSYMKQWKMDSEIFMEQMSAMFWKNIVGIYNIIARGECSETDSCEMFHYDFRMQVPDFILPYARCSGLKKNEKIKLYLLTGHHYRLFKILSH